ncbi:hypothetical protein EON82_18990 [bacterium]|nr:MAG: hypothetical protein EON82_18990 [bacterium]
MELILRVESWKLVLTLGGVYGCPPPRDFAGRFEMTARYEGVHAEPDSWPTYFWSDIEAVDEGYAACLHRALILAVAELENPELSHVHTLNDCGHTTLTRGAMSDQTISALRKARDWCAGGAFRVVGYGGAAVILRR